MLETMRLARGYSDGLTLQVVVSQRGKNFLGAHRASGLQVGIPLVDLAHEPLPRPLRFALAFGAGLAARMRNSSLFAPTFSFSENRGQL